LTLCPGRSSSPNAANASNGAAKTGIRSRNIATYFQYGSFREITKTHKAEDDGSTDPGFVRTFEMWFFDPQHKQSENSKEVKSP
jgi:hypothetical protein